MDHLLARCLKRKMIRHGQRGAGMINHFDGPFLQRGSGIQRGNGFGSFIKGVVNFFRPLGKILKPIVTSPFVKDIGKDLISTGLDVATETIKGKKLKDAARQNLRTAKKRVLSTIHKHTRPQNDSDYDEQEGGGKKMKLATSMQPQTAVKKRRKRRRKKHATKKKKTTFKRAKHSKKKSKKRRKKVMKLKQTIFG